MLTFRAVIGLRFVRGKIIILPIPLQSSFHCRPAADGPAKARTTWAAPTFASSVGPSDTLFTPNRIMRIAPEQYMDKPLRKRRVIVGRN